MNHRTVPKRQASHLLTAVAVAVATSAWLAGCGGGSDSGSSQPAETPPANASVYWLASGTITNGQSAISVWDPANVSQSLQNYTGGAQGPLSVEAAIYDTATHTRTTLGTAMSFFVRDGHVMRVDLRAAQPHAPAQVSSVSTACELARALPLKADGSLSWLQITTTDADGNCSITAWVRSDMGAGETAKALANSRVLGTLPDANGEVALLLAAAPATSGGGEWPQALDLNLSPLGPVIGPEGSSASDQTAALLAVDASQPGQAYVAAGGQVRRLRWSGAQASLDAGNLRTLKTAPALWVQPGLLALPHDGSRLYLVDGNEVLDLHDGAADLLATLGEDEIVSQMRATSAHLVLQSDSGDYLGHFVKAVAKQGGGAKALATSAYAQFVDVVGVNADWVLLKNTSAVGSQFSRTRPDGSEASTLTGIPLGKVSAAASTGGAAQLDSVIVRSPAGDIQQISLATLSTLSLGQPGFAASDSLTIQGTAGLPGIAAAANSDGSKFDVLTFTPGKAGSLTRLTNNLP